MMLTATSSSPLTDSRSLPLRPRAFLRLLPLVPAGLALLASAVPAQQLLRHRDGPALSGYGLVAPAGDVDGDGIDDTIVGAPHDSTAGALAGSAHVLSGADGALLYVLTGGGPGARFGSSCAAAGDVDGDGLSDLIVGAPGVDRAYLHSGADGALLRVLSGGAPGDLYGQAVAGVGDVDGDGLADVAVGAPAADANGVDSGAVTVHSGLDGTVLYAASGNAGGDGFGCSLAGDGPGACMADNQGDVIIGATAAGGDRRGYVQARAKDGFGVRWQVSGSTDERLGVALAPVGDLDGDGVVDVAAGSDPQDAAGLPAGPGSVRVLSGADGALLRSHVGGAPGTGYGTALAAIGDVTGDGVPDLAVGAPLADANGPDSGTVRLYSGRDGAAWYTIHGPSSGARLGAALAFADDVSGDGVPDLSAGAPGEAAGCGGVYVFSVSRWSDAGSGLPGVDGVPRLTGQGGLLASNEATLTLTAARASTTATLVLGLALVVDGTAGTLVPTAEAEIEGLLTDTEGDLVFTFTWPAGFPSGTTVYHQFLISDPAAPGGVSRSNAVAAEVP